MGGMAPGMFPGAGIGEVVAPPPMPIPAPPPQAAAPPPPPPPPPQAPPPMPSGFKPEYAVLHDYGSPAEKIGSFNPYNALVMPDGSVRYRDPSNPYGGKAQHAFQANPNSVGLAYGGPVGAKPTPEGLASLQSEFDKIRSQYPDIKGVGHGQAYDNWRHGDFPDRPTKTSRDLTEATWRQDLTGPVLAPSQDQAMYLANAGPRPMPQRSMTASMQPPGGPPPPTYTPSAPPPGAPEAAPGSPPPAPDGIRLSDLSAEPGGVLESYTRGSPTYSQHGMGPNELPDGKFWKARDVMTQVPMPPPADAPRVAESTATPAYAQPAQSATNVAAEKLPWAPTPEGTPAKLAAAQKPYDMKKIGKLLETLGKTADKAREGMAKPIAVDPPRSSAPFIGSPVPGAGGRNMFGQAMYGPKRTIG
jgi:hypothetical protein